MLANDLHVTTDYNYTSIDDIKYGYESDWLIHN